MSESSRKHAVPRQPRSWSFVKRSQEPGEEQGAYHETLKREHKKELSEASRKLKTELDSLRKKHGAEMKTLTKKTRELEDLLEAHKEDTSERENELLRISRNLKERKTCFESCQGARSFVKESAADSGDIESELAQKRVS